MASFVDFCLDSDLKEQPELVAFINILHTKVNKSETPETVVKVADTDLAGYKNLEQYLPYILDHASASEIDNFFALWLSFAFKQNDLKQDDVALSVLKACTGSKENPEGRLRTLNNLFNSVFGKIRYQIFCDIIQYAIDTKHIYVVEPTFKNLADRVQRWNLTADQHRDLLKLVRKCYSEQKNEIKVYQWSSTYLNTYQKEKITPDAEKEACSTVLHAISLPSVFEFDDLFELDAVQALSKSSDSRSKLVFDLFKIFVQDTFSELNTFVEKNGSFVDAEKLDKEGMFLKIRLLSLSSLGANSASSTVTYEDIAKNLQVPKDDVEHWVVLGISENVLTAKLDQLNGTVSISRCLHRTFATSHWEQLSVRLGAWQASVAQLQKSMSSSIPA